MLWFKNHQRFLRDGDAFKKKKSPLRSAHRCKTQGRDRTACIVLMDNNSDPNNSWINFLPWLPRSGMQPSSLSFVRQWQPLLNARLNFFLKKNNKSHWCLEHFSPTCCKIPRVFLQLWTAWAPGSFPFPGSCQPPTAEMTWDRISESIIQALFASFEPFKDHVFKIFHLKSKD